MGLAREQSKYVLTRHPRILAYSLADTLRPHLAFLYELGIDKANIAKVKSPSVCSAGWRQHAAVTRMPAHCTPADRMCS